MIVYMLMICVKEQLNGCYEYHIIKYSIGI